MAKQYKGSLTLDWYNKQKSIILQSEKDISLTNDIAAPKINWVNRDQALFYEIEEEEGKGQTPYWVNREDIRVKEIRPLTLKKVFKAFSKDKAGTLPGMDIEYEVKEIADESSVQNILIKGDNLLALNTVKKILDNKTEEEKIKCIYIDPPYNTGSAFENYDDSLAHSEWLTLMRDRLEILKSVLREDGTIFISIDNNEIAYLQVLMDSVFGRQNRKNIITLKRGSVTGAKVINPGLVNISEFILVYSKNTDQWNPNRIFTQKSRDERYNTYILNYEKGHEHWQFIPLTEAIAIENNIDKKELRNKFKDKYEDVLQEFVISNSERVIRFASLDVNSISKSAKEVKKQSLDNKDNIFLLEREDNKRPYYVYKGNLILFAKDRLREIDGELNFSEPLTDIWTDVLPNDLHNEGGIEFRKGKKPEKLLQRIFELSTDPGDKILDCFGGSGSTFAVATKMERRWIGIEIGEHADTHILSRLISVMEGKDTAGITKSVNWQGGGSFKYYHLGESIIKLNKDGSGDFNWKLGKEFIQESFLSSYDYIIDQSVDFQEGQLFTDKKQQPFVVFKQLAQKNA